MPKKTNVLYNHAKYGSNIKTRTKWVDIGDNKWYKLLELHKTKYNYCIMTADKVECLKCFPNTHIFGSSMTDKRGVKVTKNIPLSSIVVLMLSVLPSENETSMFKDIFDDDFHSKVKSCKPNVMATYDHHGSNGSCFSFGNKPLYGKVGDKSVSVYTNKKSKIESRQAVIDGKAEYVEDKCCDVIVHAVLSLSKLIPDLKYLLSPIIDTAEKIQTALNDVVLQKVKGSSSGCWNAFLYVNGRTDNMHSENDCAYTLITVPSQVVSKNIPLCNQPVFLFQVGTKEQIMLPLVNNLSFVYNGNFVMHRQAFTPIKHIHSAKFFNISSYGNAKIFNHLRRTFERLGKKIE